MLLKRKYLFGTTIIAGVIAASAPAFAQQLPGVTVQGQSDQEATEIDEVVVTGSRIRRDPTNAPTPLITVSREDLLSTGQSTVIDYLATIPALSNSVVPSDTTGSNLGDGGLSLANLRSLGSGRTLTLINGRRQVGSNGGSLAVDVDTIPRLLIENIEIVTGGASSVYGADAVSGVLNFVLRKDFEGVEIDANYGMINQDGQANQRLSALAGVNLFDDRLNLWAFAEYDKNDEVRILDIDWYRANPGLATVDSDPTNIANGPVSDGIFDVAGPFFERRQLQILRWGQTTVANNRPASPLNDPETPFSNCTSIFAAACYNVGPGFTWVFDGPTARLADFGQRIGTSAFSTINIGGDGDNGADFGQLSRTPESESYRYAAGVNFDITDNLRFSADAKYVTEETFDIGQPSFHFFFLGNDFGPNDVDIGLSTNQFLLHLDTTAYLPANLRTAIQTNTRQTFTQPTLTQPGQPSGLPIASPWAQHSMFGPDRTQFNTRELVQVNLALEGDYDNVWFVKNFNWALSYNAGVVEVENVERSVDNQRFQLAADAVVDVAGVVNGRPGEIVCRANLLRAQNPANFLGDSFRGAVPQDLRASAEGLRALNECTPLNVFGRGNQSEAALAYIDASIFVTERNEQEQAIFFVSGELWDFFGAGPIGVALGAEKRREYTEGVGRSASTGDRFLFLNTGADFPGAEYESEEAFAELSIPLFRDTWLGEYAELSGSFRSFDYTTVGTGDVYGVNFVYRPVQDIAFKTSFNTSFRAPNLAENFAPQSQTFYNGVVDPCDTRQIVNIANTTDRANRVANCTALFNQVAARRGIANPNFDFNGNTVDPNDDYNPTYPSGIAGVAGGNPNLKPETSESFTFSTVIEPRFFPNFSLVLDYYEVQIKDVISPVTPAAASLNCVFGPSLNQSACDTLFRNNAVEPGTTAEQRSQGFEIGTPGNTGIGFIQGSVNFAKLETRGLDFTARYSLDLEENFGLNWGRLDYSVRGNWLIEQKNFTNIANPNAFTESASLVNFPRVRFSSQLAWTPNDAWTFTWVADWQTAQDILQVRDQVNNADNRPLGLYDTGNFTRHDFTVRYELSDEVTLRAGVTNAFDAEQPTYFGTGFIDNMDPYGRRFNIGLNWRPF
jgi:outer membrane receptor protein involved in Fe transport